METDAIGDEPGQGRREMAAAALVLALWAGATVLRFWGNWGEDLSALYFAARFAAEGAWGLVYAGPDHVIGYGMTPEWEAAAAALGHAGDDLNRYLYPPLWAALFAPLAVSVGPAAFCNGAVVVLSGGLALAALAVVRLAQAGGMPPVRAALLSVAVMQLAFPFEFALWLLQPQILVVAAILWSVERALAGREVSAGLLLALAAAVKITPALLALAFLACGMRRAALAGAVGGAALLGASVALAGVAAHAAFLGALAEVKAVVLLSVANPSLAALLTLGLEHLRGVDLGALESSVAVAPAAGLEAVVAAVALLGVGASLWAVRRAPRRLRLVLGVAMLYQVATFAGGFAWLHYLMLPYLLLVWLPTVWPMGRSLLAAAVLTVPMSTAVFLAVLDEHAQNVGLTGLSAAAIVGFWGLFAAVGRAAGRAQAGQGHAGRPVPA